MTKLSAVLAPVLLLAATGAAQAGGKAGTFGLGGEIGLAAGGPIGEVSGNYDLGQFHVGGYVGLQDGEGEDNTSYQLGGRFYYHLHSTLSSDFGVGGTIGWDHQAANTPNIDDDEANDYVFIQPGFQIRAFLNGGNVALSATGGITVGAADAGGITIGADFVGVAGISYYFF